MVLVKAKKRLIRVILGERPGGETDLIKPKTFFATIFLRNFRKYDLGDSRDSVITLSDKSNSVN